MEEAKEKGVDKMLLQPPKEGMQTQGIQTQGMQTQRIQTQGMMVRIFAIQVAEPLGEDP